MDTVDEAGRIVTHALVDLTVRVLLEVALRVGQADLRAAAAFKADAEVGGGQLSRIQYETCLLSGRNRAGFPSGDLLLPTVQQRDRPRLKDLTMTAAERLSAAISS